MKSFKQFLKENQEEKHSGTANGVPIAVVINIRKKKVEKPRKLKESRNDITSWENKPDNDNEMETIRNLHDNQQTKEMDWDSGRDRALNSYTADSSGLNKRLFKEHEQGTTDDKKSTLDEVVEKHKIPAPMHVYSGVGFNPQKVAAGHPEGHIHLPAFTSTSIQKTVASEFALNHEHENEPRVKHIIHFHLKRGQKGIYVGRHDEHHADEQISEHPDESEFILPRNTKVKIHPNPKIFKDSNNGTTVHIHKATVV